MSEQANPKPGVAKSGVAKSGVVKSGVPKSGPVEEVVPDCPHCGKPLPLCICDSVTPIESRISLLILQHPQEQDRALGTARLTAMHFEDAVLKIGLSWPSLSKALWWRNAWMLKCQRVILGPKQPSRYGKLRKEPRGDGLATIEAAAMLLAGLQKRPDIAETLNGSFERSLARYREVQTTMPELAPKPKKRDYRRRKGSKSGPKRVAK